jgi:hypothetical protein
MIPDVDKNQIYYRRVVFRIAIVSCLISLITPFFILLFPGKNYLNEVMLLSAASSTF